MIIGVDVGKSGALALLNNDGSIVEIHDMPVKEVMVGTKERSEVDAVVLAEILFTWMRQFPEVRAIIEHVSSMPSDGHVGAFRFGESYGILKGVFGAVGIPYDLIRPQAWKKEYGLLGSEKEMSRICVKMLYPEATEFQRKKDDGRADAVLIARTGIT